LSFKFKPTKMEIVKILLEEIAKGFTKGFFMNGVILTVVYLIFWKLFKEKIKNFRIQFKQRADAKQIKQEIINSIGASMSGALFGSIVFYLSTKGYTKVYTDINEYNKFFAYSGFFILLIIDDAWFYWTHRLLHHPKIYKYVHAVHHKSIDVTPYTSMSFHAIEPMIATLWIIPVAFIFPMYMPALAVLQIYGLLDNIKSHLGYEFFPKNFNKSWLRFLSSSTYHNMHHSKFNGNYGVHFRFWDRLCGTEFKDYEQEFEIINDRKNGIINNHISIVNAVSIANVTVNYNGTNQVSINENETILESLIRQEITVPYACKKGNCGTCKCQLINGEVDTKPSRAITEEEIASGLILICQSKPKTENIVVTVLN
jgi:Delta7-sterol 5-desaturase